MIHLGNYNDVLQDVRADLIFTSPPYNIGSKAPRQDGFRRSGKFDPKSYGAIHDYPDDLPESIYQQQQIDFFHWAASHITINGTLVYNHKPRRKDGQMIHPAEWFLKVRELSLREEIIWDRGSTHNHGRNLMWPQTERLYVFSRSDGRYCLNNNKKLSYRSDVWRINRARGNGHNAPFPSELANSVIETWSNHGQLVCDPFSGSGTTARVALALGRRFVGAEIMPKYKQLADDLMPMI